MSIAHYWDGIEAKLDSLVERGFVKLPSLKVFDLDTIAEGISREMGGRTFVESSPRHIAFLEELDIDQFLTPKLYEIAKEVLGYKGEINNQYHIARCVSPGDSIEMFRAHFDSHLFTLVLPIKIPRADSGGSVGELVYFPRARAQPKSEIINFLGKAAHKRFASKQGVETFAKSHRQISDDFQDYSPLLFIGNTTLHTNKQVAAECSTYRLTLLAHFFDPSPKYGIGGLLRLFRNR